ncbi:hypothetical protein ACWGNM_22765 [Streptomyces sp. NPDC055796]
MPAFEQDWVKALEDARHAYSLPLPARDAAHLAAAFVAAPAVDAFIDCDRDDADCVHLDDVLGART